MAGFPLSDQNMVTNALREFMPHTVDVKRATISLVGGDSDVTGLETIASNIRCRVMPVTERMKRSGGFAEGAFEIAEYIITLDYDSQITVGDSIIWQAQDEEVSIELTSIKYDAATWQGVIRALGVRNE